MNMLESVFDWLLTTTLRASALAVVILGMQLLLRRWLPPQWRHSLWVPLLIVLALPVLPSVPFGLFPRKAVVTASEPAVARIAADDTAPAAALPVAALPQAASWKINPWALTWLAGSVIVLGTGIASYRRNMRRILKGAVPASPALRHSIEGAAHDVTLRRKPRVIVSTAVESPAVTGLVRPTLLLPAGFPEGFSASEARLILLHEFTHLKRFDLPVNWLTCVFQAMHWFNPILWFAFARMRADRESACDAQVLSLDQDDCRSAYGHALLKLQSAAPHPGLNLGFVGIFERSAELKTRIREISSHRKAHPAWRAGGVIMIGTLTVFGATKAQEPRAAEPKENTVPKVLVDGVDPNSGRAYIEKKLDAIIIPMVKAEDTSLEEMIDFLRARSKELDSEPDVARKGVNFVIRKPRGGTNGADPGSKRLTLDLKKVSLRQAFDEICAQTDLAYKVDDFAVTFVPAAELKEPAIAATPRVPALKGKAIDAAKKIVIPIVAIEDTTLVEAVDFLNAQAKELADGKPGFQVVIDPKVPADVRIRELRLRTVPLTEAVKYFAEATKSSITANDTEIRFMRP